MARRIEELNRKVEQGSQQLQGEAQELQLEAMLCAKFPHDTIERVAKGETGGDLLQHVVGPNGQHCGTIIWESKRTKNWSDGWLPKLREDMRAANADVALLVSQALPKTVPSFDLIEGVWVTEPRCALPVAIALRQSLIAVASAKTAVDGQQTKVELVYRYLTGPRFRHRIEAIVNGRSPTRDSRSVCYFCSKCHDPSHPSPGEFVARPSMRLMNNIDGPSLGTDSSAAAKARRASSQCRAR
jgi:hypothetical protein